MHYAQSKNKKCLDAVEMLSFFGRRGLVFAFSNESLYVHYARSKKKKCLDVVEMLSLFGRRGVSLCLLVLCHCMCITLDPKGTNAWIEYNCFLLFGRRGLIFASSNGVLRVSTSWIKASWHQTCNLFTFCVFSCALHSIQKEEMLGSSGNAFFF